MKGIKLKINKRKGKIAMKKLKEILPARAVNAPLIIPRKYISIRSYKEKPLKPGNLIESKKFFNNFKFYLFISIKDNIDLNILYINIKYTKINEWRLFY